MRRPSVTNVLAGLGFFWLGTCAVNQAITRETIAVTIESTARPAGRDPTRVRFYCNGSQSAIAHNLSIAVPARLRVPVNASCPYIRFVVETIGGDYWVSDGIYVEPGDRLEIRIAPILAATFYMVYH